MIGFAGLSHLGIVSSIAAASKGADVVAFDENEFLAVALQSGEIPFVEPGLSDLLLASRSRIHFTSDLEALRMCELVFISADVSTDNHNESDLTAIMRLVEQVSCQLPPDGTLVILSQVLPGFTRSAASKVRKDDARKGLHVFYQVETLVFGNAVARATQPERVIVGCENPTERLPVDYGAVLSSFNCPTLPMRYESAELAKIAINMFLVSSVSVTNMLAEISEVIDADWSEIAPALRLDRRIGPHAYLTPGLGIAGGNLERDLFSLRKLAQENGADAGLVDKWVDLSAYHRFWALRIIFSQILPRCPEPVFAIWGLAYKSNTDSVRNSAAVPLLEALRSYETRFYDPVAILPEGVAAKPIHCQSALEACSGADVLVVMTPWPEFSKYEPSQLIASLRGRFFVDPFGVLAPKIRTQSNVSYFRLGAPAQRMKS